jgi:hypothetical protein
MEVTVDVHVVKSVEDLIEYRSDETGGERTSFSGLGELVEVALHALENEVELAGGREEEGVVEGNEVGVHRNVA